jgi:apolipoprotein N-acyltransferase
MKQLTAGQLLGVTPFVRWGNYAFLLIAGVMLLIAALIARRV